MTVKIVSSAALLCTVQTCTALHCTALHCTAHWNSVVKEAAIEAKCYKLVYVANRNLSIQCYKVIDEFRNIVRACSPIFEIFMDIGTVPWSQGS